MTVRLLMDYFGQPANSLITLTSAEETQLVNAKMASTDLTGGTTYVPPAANTKYLENAQITSSPEGNGLALAVKDSLRPIARGLTVMPITRDNDGIDAAINTIILIGNGRGTVMYEDADYVLTTGIQMQSNISHVGVLPKLVFAGNVPDSYVSSSGGTRFLLSAGITGFYFNNVANATLPPLLASTACSSIELYGLTFVGGKTAIDTGAYFAMGLTFSRVDEIYCFNQTGESINYENFQHTTFGRHFVFNDLALGNGTPRGGIFWRASLDSTLLPGNSDIAGEIYIINTQRVGYGAVFELRGPADCYLNTLKVTGRVQCNRFATASLLSVTATTTAASPDISVPNATEFAQCQVGMPIVFSSTSPNPLAQYTAYFVQSRNTANNTIRVANRALAAAGITINATGTYTGSIGGYPALAIQSNINGLFTNCDFGNWELEPFWAVCCASITATRTSRVGMNDLIGSKTKNSLVVRDADIRVDLLNMTEIGRCDVSGNGILSIHNQQAGHFILTVGRTLKHSDHQMVIVYNSASAATFTIPGDMVYGFNCKFIQAGAGIITIAAGGGATVASRAGGLRSGGQYAELTLRQTSLAMGAYASTYALSGDTQV